MSSSINTVDNLITFLLSGSGWREVWSIPTKSSILLSECDCSWWFGNPWPKWTNIQWLFLVPRKRWDRWHTIPQLAVYTTYNILPSGGLYATYHLLGEPETTIETLWDCWFSQVKWHWPMITRDPGTITYLIQRQLGRWVSFPIDMLVPYRVVVKAWYWLIPWHCMKNSLCSLL